MPPLPADSLRTETSSGQMLYVPVNARIHFRDQDRTINLAATINIRNTDYADSLQLTGVDYYDSQGNLVHRYLKKPRWLSPLSSTSFVVEEEDERGASEPTSSCNGKRRKQLPYRSRRPS